MGRVAKIVTHSYRQKDFKIFVGHEEENVPFALTFQSHCYCGWECKLALLSRWQVGVAFGKHLKL